MLTDLDKIPIASEWLNPVSEGRKRIAAATDEQLIAELRKPTSNFLELREATAHEALARILGRKP